MKPLLLIAEGDAGLCEVYRSVLTQLGYEVEIARDGLDCLAKLRQRRPAVLVLDWELHWGGAAGVLACLREQNEDWQVPVILTETGEFSADDPIDHDAPVRQVLAKPFTLSTLTECLNSTMALSPNRPPYCRKDSKRQIEFVIG